MRYRCVNGGTNAYASATPIAGAAEECDAAIMPAAAESARTRADGREEDEVLIFVFVCVREIKIDEQKREEANIFAQLRSGPTGRRNEECADLGLWQKIWMAKKQSLEVGKVPAAQID